MLIISCCICYDAVLPDNVLLHLKCGHIFHNHCLEEWIKRSKTCPQCRKRAIKPTRIFPNFAVISSDDFNEQLTVNAMEFQGKYNKVELQVTQLTQQLAEKDVELVATERSMTQLSETKTKLIDDLRNEIDRMEKRLNEVKLELKNSQIDLTGRNKLIECLDRVNSELEKQLNKLEIENRCLKEQVDTIQLSGSCRQIKGKRSINELINQQHVTKKLIVDLTDDGPIIIDDDDEDC